MLLGNKTRQLEAAALTRVARPGALLAAACRSPPGAGWVWMLRVGLDGWVWMCLRDAEGLSKALFRD